ncbi:hypothetical protein FJ941_15650 [Mesorhizobium sp. B2-3-13]|nr:hypothetical protein FJ941_15650 [Mesorhizobium sp. B2-3-13]
MNEVGSAPHPPLPCRASPPQGARCAILREACCEDCGRPFSLPWRLFGVWEPRFCGVLRISGAAMA